MSDKEKISILFLEAFFKYRAREPYQASLDEAIARAKRILN